MDYDYNKKNKCNYDAIIESLLHRVNSDGSNEKISEEYLLKAELEEINRLRKLKNSSYDRDIEMDNIFLNGLLH